ncbi:hypothetical protein R83H12_02280 [Fibrobacteria bacterium R8-3-H12]
MNYKHWCAFFAGLLFFACSSDNVNLVDSSSSNASEPGVAVSSSSALAEEHSCSSGTSDSGTESSSSASTHSSNDSVSSSSATISSSARVSSSSGVPSSAAASSSSARPSSSNSVSSSSATIAGSSSSGSGGSLSNGTRFTPEMLGLTPGATTASVNLNWISDRNTNGKTEVRLLNSSGGLVKTFTGTVANATTGKSHHKATLTDLTPGTNYKYSVSNNGTDWSYEYNYKTPPSGNVFTFAIVADPQVTTGNQDSNTNPKASPATTAQGWKDIVEKIADKEATFILCAGDQVDGGISYKEDEYKVFFAPEQLRNIPLAPVVGNHDLHTEYFYHFNMPNLTSSNAQPYSMYNGKAANYYYLYNNILIVAFNTGYLQKSDNVAAAIAEYKKNIEAAKAAHSGKYDWLIVQHHKSTTSISAHSADEDIGLLIKNGWEKLMTDQGVDIVISGHDHIHVRSHLMKWDESKGYSVRSTDNKGTMYLTFTTASGVKYYPPLFILNEGQENAGPFTEDFPVLVNGKRGASQLRNAKASDTTTWPLSTAFFVKPSGSNYMPNYTPNYTIFEVNGKTIKATTRTSQDKLVDEFTLTPKGR